MINDKNSTVIKIERHSRMLRMKYTIRVENAACVGIALDM